MEVTQNPGKLTEYYTITERLSKFEESPTLRRALNGALGVGINIWDVMQNKKILLINLHQSTTDYFLASLIVSKIQQAIFGRDFIPKEDRIPFYAYVDECDRVMKFCAEDFGEFLIRARKFNLCLTMANPIPGDLPAEFRRKFGAIGALIFFNLDRKDSKEFADRISPWESLADLTKFTALVCTRGNRPTSFKLLSSLVAVPRATPGKSSMLDPLIPLKAARIALGITTLVM